MSEEAFYRSVIQTISLSRHTLRYAELFEFLNVQRMRVMHALIKQVADIGRIYRIRHIYIKLPLQQVWRRSMLQAFLEQHVICILHYC